MSHIDMSQSAKSYFAREGMTPSRRMYTTISACVHSTCPMLSLYIQLQVENVTNFAGRDWLKNILGHYLVFPGFTDIVQPSVFQAELPLCRQS